MAGWRGACKEDVAVIGYLGIVEAGSARANLGQHTSGSRCIAAVAAVVGAT